MGDLKQTEEQGVSQQSHYPSPGNRQNTGKFGEIGERSSDFFFNEHYYFLNV